MSCCQSLGCQVFQSGKRSEWAVVGSREEYLQQALPWLEEAVDER